MKYYDETLMIFSDLHYQLTEKDQEREFRAALRECEDIQRLPAGLRYLLSDEVPVDQIRKTVSEYYEKYLNVVEQKNEGFRAAALQLTAADAMIDYFEDTPILCLKQAERDVHIQNGWYRALLWDLVLQNAHCKDITVYANWFELSKTDEGFLLEIRSDENEYFSISFTDVVERSQPYNALKSRLSFYPGIHNPWEYLSLIAEGISEHIEYNVANKKELAVKELVAYLCDTQKKAVPPQCFIEIFGQVDAKKAVLKLGKSKVRLFRELSKQKYESLWRKIYRMLADTQVGLPSLAELKYSEEELREHREFITRELQKNGFEGEYPYFCKKGIPQKLHFAKSYGMTYFVGHEKNARCYIACNAIPAGHHIDMEFYCGIVFCESENEETDIFSCMFDRKGKAYFSHVAAAILTDEENEGELIPSRKMVISAAVKSAQLLKLSKEERGYKNVFGTSPLLFLMFLFMAVFFGLGMMVGLMLTELITTSIVTGSLSACGEIFIETPWWLIALGSGVPFALIMVILEALANRK